MLTHFHRFCVFASIQNTYIQQNVYVTKIHQINYLTFLNVLTNLGFQCCRSSQFHSIPNMEHIIGWLKYDPHQKKSSSKSILKQNFRIAKSVNCIYSLSSLSCNLVSLPHLFWRIYFNISFLLVFFSRITTF